MVGLPEIKARFLDAIDAAERREEPYRHWNLTGLLPDETVRVLNRLPFPAPSLDGVSGTREAHNATRVYFDKAHRTEFEVCEQVATMLQDREVIAAVGRGFGADLNETYLRIEYAQDTDGFWLQPHTDIGVKRFTMLLYLSDDPAHAELGTDIYAAADSWFGRSDFGPNKALVFVPSDTTWHGFEARPICGVRKSMIINYVTQDWRAREQLAFPEQLIEVAPVAA